MLLLRLSRQLKKKKRIISTPMLPGTTAAQEKVQHRDLQLQGRGLEGPPGRGVGAVATECVVLGSKPVLLGLY